jgi:hypothetical protein
MEMSRNIYVEPMEEREQRIWKYIAKINIERTDIAQLDVTAREPFIEDALKRSA